LDKPKLLALINLLKVQVGSVADASVRERLIERIDKLEDEIRNLARDGAGSSLVFLYYTASSLM
jgi:hypothetical protein